MSKCRCGKPKSWGAFLCKDCYKKKEEAKERLLRMRLAHCKDGQPHELAIFYVEEWEDGEWVNYKKIRCK